MKPTTSLVFVYGLADDSGVRYVGKCRHLASRYSQHLGRTQAVPAMMSWIDGIAPFVPVLWVLHATPSDVEARELELIEIKEQLGLGRDLININDRPPGSPKERSPRRYGLPTRRSRHLRQRGDAGLFEREIRRAYAGGVPLRLPRYLGDGCLYLSTAERGELEALVFKILRRQQATALTDIIAAARAEEPISVGHMREAIRGLLASGALVDDGVKLVAARKAWEGFKAS